MENTEIFGLYEPYNDKYRIHKLKSDFYCYDKQANFDGDMVLKPTGLIGEGIMNLDNSQMKSEVFIFNANWFDADTADLSVFTDLGEIAFKSNNLKTHIDLSLRTGDFYSNGKGSYVELPANKYICYIDKLHWNMDEETLTLGENDENARGTKFVSVHPSQDSLSFIAKTSSYNINENIIKLKEVKEILVADAIVNQTEDFII